MKKLSSLMPFGGTVFLLLSLVFGGCDGSDSAAQPSGTGTNAVSQTATTNVVATNATGVTNASVPQRQVVTPKPPPAVVGLTDGDVNGFSFKMTGRPDFNRLREYLVVTPAVSDLTFDWTYWSHTCHVRGSFKPRTTYEVVVKAGLPMDDERTTVREFRRTFTTGDCKPDFAFAANGRYLPATGARAVAVKTMNVAKIRVHTREVSVRNLVQLLAREEDRYRNYYGGGGDSRNTVELAGDVVRQTIDLPSRLNAEIVTPIPLRDIDGQTAKGVYLVSINDVADKDEEDDDEGWHWKWRLVCVTDIGLSVRQVKSGVSVWATSLTTGRPLKGVDIRVYNAANIILAEVKTDDEGWGFCELASSAEPFAVVATRRDDPDVSFLALAHELDETIPSENRPYVEPQSAEAFVWTDRGIYRHGEPIFVQALFRDDAGRAPKPFPVELLLKDPDGKIFKRMTGMPDVYGSLTHEAFAVTDDQMSGEWELSVRTPGDEGTELGTRTVKVEEFVPPQIRVNVQTDTVVSTGNVTRFTVSAEHLFGGAAQGLPVEGTVSFKDVPFAPKGWEAFRFGDATRSLPPNFVKLSKQNLDDNGTAVFDFKEAFKGNWRPRALVQAVLQGTVFETGGRPVSARAQGDYHYYPYYIGVQIPANLRSANKPKACRVALVKPDGTPFAGKACKLKARFERIDYVYGLKRQNNGAYEWRSDKVRYPLGEDRDVDVAANGTALLDIPVSQMGDYAVRVWNPEDDVSFDTTYWVGGSEDDSHLRASLANPSRVALSLDREIYYPGDQPRLTVKAPFAGSAWLTVMRDDMVYSQVVTLGTPTGEIELQPVTRTWAPGVDVSLTVVQACKPGARFTANRAYGVVPLKATTRESAVKVEIVADVVCPPSGGAELTARVSAKGEGSVVADRAVVTVVDEGINMLTDEPTPDPTGWFGEVRLANHPLYDIFSYLLPVLDGGVRRSGIKTGGGADGDLFRRMSPQPSRRFKPLSLWKRDVPLVNGVATVPFKLPEFVGEVRVTAVAYNRRATGAASVQAKVTPKLVQQSDAPRFVAPGDVFEATLTLSNRSGADGTVTYDATVSGAATLARPMRGTVTLKDGASETIRIPVKAGVAAGEAQIILTSEGFGEKHTNTLDLPVRPGVAWKYQAQTVVLAPGERKEFANPSAQLPETAQRRFAVSGSMLGELTAALEYLISYPHGCLEQTTSQVYPLVAAGGILNRVSVRESSVAEDAKDVVAAGVLRVVSMLRVNDFVMWPDCDSAPWNRDVSIWAAEFLVAADKAGFSVPRWALDRVKNEFLPRWAMSDVEATSIYASQILAKAGKADLDRLLHWFDRRDKLAVRNRYRLARAFTATGDRERARELTKVVPAGEGVLTTAEGMLALLELDPSDARLPNLVVALMGGRDKTKSHWGTTALNAHALIALGTYARTHHLAAGTPDVILVDGESSRPIPTRHAVRLTGGGTVTVQNRGTNAVYVTASSLTLPDAANQPAESSGIGLMRRYLRMDGTEADFATLVRGDLLIVELTLKPERDSYEDLVIEDLLPGCFEPDTTSVDREMFAWIDKHETGDWELRRDLRDDRVLIFSRRFNKEGCIMSINEDGTFNRRQIKKAYYAVRVVGAGTFLHPGVSVEAMYEPEIHARTAGGTVEIKR